MSSFLLAQVALPDSFFTRGSIVTFTGMVAGIYIICNASQKAFDFNPRWMGLIIALGLCFFGTTTLSKATPLDYFLAVVNGCLVFLAAAGGSQLPPGGGGARGGPGPAFRGAKRRFFSSWF